MVAPPALLLQSLQREPQRALRDASATAVVRMSKKFCVLLHAMSRLTITFIFSTSRSIVFFGWTLKGMFMRRFCRFVVCVCVCVVHVAQYIAFPVQCMVRVRKER